MIKLSKRLQAVARLVTPGEAVCDVGTDHGYVPIYLLETGKKKRALAMDVNKGPLLRAKEHIKEQGLSEYIVTRLSNGLAAMEPKEADSVVIAGMGGGLMIQILEDGFDRLETVKELILQPQSDIAQVRSFVRTHGFCIDAQEMVKEDGKYYMMFRCVKADVHKTNTQTTDIQRTMEEVIEPDLQAAYDKYGEHLIKENHPILREYLAKEEAQLTAIRQSLSGIIDSRKARSRSLELEQKQAVIAAARKEMDNALQ